MTESRRVSAFRAWAEGFALCPTAEEIIIRCDAHTATLRQHSSLGLEIPGRLDNCGYYSPMHHCYTE